jgi:hypothetical protein
LLLAAFTVIGIGPEVIADLCGEGVGARDVRADPRFWAPHVCFFTCEK